MSIAPYAAGAAGARHNTQRLVDMRTQMVDLERQLSSGQKAQSFGALGFDRRLSLDARAKISGAEAFKGAIADAQLRLKFMLQSLTSLEDVAADTRKAFALRAFAPDSAVVMPMKETARQHLALAIDALNVEINDRYLFSGQDHDRPSVKSLDRLLGGEGQKVGLEALVSEHVRAHTGADENGVMAEPGRLIIGTSGDTVNVASTTGLPFGFTVLPSGEFSFDAALPLSSGDTFEIQLSDKQDNLYAIKLRAAVAPIGPGEFSISGSPFAIAASFEAALRTAVEETARTGLMPRITLDISQQFFSSDRVAVKRVEGNTLIDGDINTQVVWYSGDAPATGSRSTVPVRIDANQIVGLGAQANEKPIAELLASLATLSMVKFENTQAGRDAYDAVTMAISKDLNPAPDSGIAAIATELAVAGTAMQTARERHTLTGQMLLEILNDVEAARPEEVAAQLLSLQTRLQASYQTTSLLSNLSLVNYL